MAESSKTKLMFLSVLLSFALLMTTIGVTYGNAATRLTTLESEVERNRAVIDSVLVIQSQLKFIQDTQKEIKDMLRNHLRSEDG